MFLRLWNLFWGLFTLAILIALEVLITLDQPH